MSQKTEYSLPISNRGKTSPFRIVAVILMLAVAVCFMALVTNGQKKAQTDFICYWSAGRQLIRHQNPYDPVNILRIEEQATGSNSTRARFMRNAPDAFFLAYPLGFLSERSAAIVWSLLIIAALIVSIRLLCMMLGNPQDGIHLVGYCFPPVLACMLTGQSAIFLLLGVVLFFYLIEKRPMLAGAALLLCGLKPHLFLPFGVVLLAWVFTRKSYRVLAGFGLALLCSCAFSFYLDPQGWTHYAKMMESERIQNEFIPTISLMFRLLWDRHLIWLQFVPAALACIWAVPYFWRNRENWNWFRQGILLLPVSILVAPYAWFTDESLVLPAILVGLFQISKDRRRFTPFIIIAGVAFLEVMIGFDPNSGLYIWTAPAWLIWYIFATRMAPVEGTPIRSNSTDEIVEAAWK